MIERSSGDLPAESVVPFVLPWASCFQIAGLAGPGEEYVYKPSYIHRLGCNHAVNF